MVTMLDALARSADRIFSSLDRPAEGGALSQYVASLGGGSEEQVALEKSLRLLHMFVRFGDALGTVQACDALVQLIRTGGATRQAVLDGSALPSLVLVLQTERPDSWRAATELLLHHECSLTPPCKHCVHHPGQRVCALYARLRRSRGTLLNCHRCRCSATQNGTTTSVAESPGRCVWRDDISRADSTIASCML